MSRGGLVPAAQYLRMSKQTQQYSLLNQREAIRSYAIRNGFLIVRTYLDAGRTGVNLRQRPGMRNLLHDVESGRPDFKAILTYDVSRWGRFQDTDEAASYEFLCKRAGIGVHYCAEEFSNCGSASSSIAKILKRMMAAEYSRELSVKVYASQRRLAQLGFRMGGPPPYGLRRLIVSPDGTPTQNLVRGERKGSGKCHVILVPGPKSEVDCVRLIFSMALDPQRSTSQIASALNSQQRVIQPWTKRKVFRILTNPVYAGCGVWGRTTQKIQGHLRRLSPSRWILAAGSYKPIVEKETFERVRTLLTARKSPRKPDEELLLKLKLLLKKKRELSTRILSDAPGIPGAATYVRHFGSLREAYRRIGYRTSERVAKINQSSHQTRELRKQLLEHLQSLFPDALRVKHYPGLTREIIEVDGKIRVSVYLCRETALPAQNRKWVLRIRPAERRNLALVALVDSTLCRIRGFYLLPPFGDSIKLFRFFRENDSRFAGGEKLKALGDLCAAARRLDVMGNGIRERVPEGHLCQSKNATFEAEENKAGGAAVTLDVSSSLGLTPVAQYIRMSTDRQQNSTENQKNAIAKFAEQHRMGIVRTYEDLGKSGLLLKQRPGLKSLVHDVLIGKASFKAILVSDVSRWGRFQDPDESAHYEFLCRSCGIPIYYCSEMFSDEVNLENSALKTMKRVMAAEFSQELSTKVVEAAKKCVQLGYRVGGVPGFGYRRFEVTAEGKPRCQLRFGERKYVETDRVILVPGPRNEVNVVRRIFRDVIKSRESYVDIANKLNREGLTRDGVPWTRESIRKLLINPKYAGHNIWNRSSGRLGTKRAGVRPEHWIVKQDAFTPIVPSNLFDLAQKRRRTWADRLWSDEEIISSLQRLLLAKGKLTERLLKKTPGMPNQDNLRKRFGSCQNTWRMAGYELANQYKISGNKFANGQQLRKELLERIANLFPDRVKTLRLSGQHRRLLKVDDDVTVSMLCCRRERTSYGKLRWMITPVAQERDFITLVCLLNRTNKKVCKLYLFPRIDIRARYRIADRDQWLAQGIRLRRLTDFCDIVQACQQNR